MEKRKVNILLPADLADAVGHQAVNERRRPSHVIADALREYLARKDQKDRKPRQKGATCAAR